MATKIKINRKENTIIIEHPHNSDLYYRIKDLPGTKRNFIKNYWEIKYFSKFLERFKLKFPEFKIEVNNNYYLFELERELKIQQYSEQTIKNYLLYNLRLLDHSKKTPDQITNYEIRNYLYYMVKQKNINNSILNLVISSLKFFYGIVLKKDFIYEIIRPISKKSLPIVLNKVEISKIIKSIRNIKHKTLITLIYSSGLRVSEAAKMKISDIDFSRKMIHITSGKGNKDRYTILSEKIISLLYNYKLKYKPEFWLFEGQYKENHITVRTIQKIFSDICKKINIQKKATVHTLRHSFATHLLDKGIDIKHIQELLGHKSTKTTEIYTHVTLNKLSNIKSPLDDLF
jgi:integrase/recombinase XerD